jgi:hypothetical protein
MTRRLIGCAVVALGLVLGLGLAGCGSQPGKTLQTYGRGKTPPPLATLDQDATLALYPSNGVTPLYTAKLSRGDQYGFRKEGDKTVAVAGDQTIPLEGKLTTSYYWKKQKGSE